MARKNKSVTSNWLDEGVEVPRIQSSANRDRSRKQKWYRRAIWVSVVVLPFSLVMNLLNSAHGGATVVHDSSSKVDTLARATATLAVQNWLNSTVSPVVGQGQIVSWDGEQTVPMPKPITDSSGKVTKIAPDYTTELQEFTVADALQQTFRVDVQVGVNKEYGATVLAGPSLIPIPQPDTDAFNNLKPASPWPGVSSVSVPSAVQQAIQVWATAFTSGDSSKLRLAVQDKNSSHTYQTLPNVAHQTTTVVSGGYLFPTEKEQVNSAGDTSSSMVVQVSMQIQWDGQPAPTSTTDVPASVYDLLISSANTAAPTVVAWGSPGTGPQLKAYQNALTHTSLVSAPKPTATPSPDGSTSAGN